jgi:hypothetical protein
VFENWRIVRREADPRVAEKFIENWSLKIGVYLGLRASDFDF